MKYYTINISSATNMIISNIKIMNMKYENLFCIYRYIHNYRYIQLYNLHNTYYSPAALIPDILCFKLYTADINYGLYNNMDNT